MIRKLLTAGTTIAALAIAPSAFAQTTLPSQVPTGQPLPGGVVVEGQPGTQPRTGGQPMNQLPRPYHAKQVIGSKVNLQGTQAVGTVDDIVFSESGTVEYMIVNNNGKLTTVPWRAAKFDYQNRTATLGVTPEQYQQVPTYTQQEAPNYYNPQYRNDVYKQYNVQPQPIQQSQPVRDRITDGVNNQLNKQLDKILPGTQPQPQPNR